MKTGNVLLVALLLSGAYLFRNEIRAAITSGTVKPSSTLLSRSQLVSALHKSPNVDNHHIVVSSTLPSTDLLRAWVDAAQNNKPKFTIYDKTYYTETGRDVELSKIYVSN